MASVLQIASPDAIRRIQRVQTVTIAWMSLEAAVSLFASWRASNPALLAFGGDSAIELFSAVVVLWRFRASADAHEGAERRAVHVVGSLLLALADLCRRYLGHESAGLQRIQTKASGDSHFDRSCRRHAVACGREATTVRSHRQCDVEGGRRAVGAVCLPVADRLGGAGDQRDLASKLGRPDCGFGDPPAHRLGGSGSDAWQGLPLLLGSHLGTK